MFNYEVFCIELSYEWVDCEKFGFFHRMLPHSSVAMESILVSCY